MISNVSWVICVHDVGLHVVAMEPNIHGSAALAILTAILFFHYMLTGGCELLLICRVSSVCMQDMSRNVMLILNANLLQ